MQIRIDKVSIWIKLLFFFKKGKNKPFFDLLCEVVWNPPVGRLKKTQTPAYRCLETHLNDIVTLHLSFSQISGSKSQLLRQHGRHRWAFCTFYLEETYCDYPIFWVSLYGVARVAPFWQYVGISLEMRVELIWLIESAGSTVTWRCTRVRFHRWKGLRGGITEFTPAEIHDIKKRKRRARRRYFWNESQPLLLLLLMAPLYRVSFGFSTRGSEKGVWLDWLWLWFFDLSPCGDWWPPTYPTAYVEAIHPRPAQY